MTLCALKYAKNSHFIYEKSTQFNIKESKKMIEKSNYQSMYITSNIHTFPIFKNLIKENMDLIKFYKYSNF